MVTNNRKTYNQKNKFENIRKMINKFNLLITLTLLYSGNLFGQTYNKQNTYLDALKLKAIKEQNKSGLNLDNRVLHEDFYEILFKYGLNETNIDSNIFLKGLGIEENPLALANNGSLSIREINYSKPKQEFSAIESMNWQASAINGMANFMVGRFKQEILQVSIDQIFKQIKTKEDSILVKSIFPKTFKQIGDLYGSGSSSYYTADLLLLRQTAQIDIEQLPKNIIKNPETIFPKLKNEPKIKDMLALGNYIVEYSQQGQSLDRLLSILSTETYSSDSTVYKILNVADLISQALLNKEGSKDIWVNPINTLPTTATSLKNLEITYFYGLLYQQLIQIPEFKNYLENQDSNDIVLVAAKIQDLVRFVNKLNNTYNYIKSKEFNLKSPEEIVTYIKDINQTISFFTTTLNKIPEINNLYNLDDALLDVSERYITIVEALMTKDYQKVIPLLIIEFGDYMNDKNVKSSRTIAFVSQLATIESAYDMKALLNSYALPIGGASIKRNSSFNISINGYVGLTGGWETAYGTQKNQTKGNIGLSAPIGISATFCNGYLTPFVSFIDLGSIVNQRLNNDTTSYSNLKFEHFFTPGIGLFVNFPKLPITAGVHCNYVPNLRTIKYESGNATITESDRSVTRINFSVLVDIPFFTLYNKEKKK
jgi:hypothetical protein